MKNVKINIGELKRRCKASLSDFLSEGELRTGQNGQHVFQDNGARILAVCHLDTVQQSNEFCLVKHKGDTFVMCPKLDDRLGAYIILDLLPKLGCKFDVLLTDNEERGRSTAQDFTGNGKAYSWMFSFDRMGVQTVMYEFGSKHLRRAVRRAGATTGYGSYSDICELEHLGCAGVNWGTGFYDYHSLNAYASLRDIAFCVNTFLVFYEQNRKQRFAYKPRPRKSLKYVTSYRWDNSAWKKAFDQDRKDYVALSYVYNDARDDWTPKPKEFEDETFYDNEYFLRDEFWFDPYSATEQKA